MPNSDATHVFATALPLAPSADTVAPYGLSESTSREPQGAQAIALPIHNDINADGQGDLIWRNYSNGANAVWKTPTATNVGAEFIEGLGDTNWRITAAGDFNNDGYSDLLWRNEESGQNVLWYLNDGVVQERRFLETLADTSWEIKAAGDFDQDGNLDILWRNNDNGSNAVWLMNSDASVRERAFIEGLGDTQWDIVGAADFDGNNSTDILWRNQKTGQNVIWSMANLNLTERSFITGLNDLDWEIEGAGDLNGDGNVSIVWRNYATGQNALWNMNGKQIAERVFLQSIDDPNWEPIVAARPTSQNNENGNEQSPVSEPPVQDNTSSNFNIQFDYRFDTNGWFNAERRAALEAAADVWESIILDEFEDTPAGTQTPFVLNPQTGEFEGTIRNAGTRFEFTEFTTDVEIDDLLIFVGAQELGSSVLGQGGASGFSPLEIRYVGEDFEPWLGSISFNSEINWFFDSTPSTRDDIPSNQNDFISTAIHEIAHVLGFNNGINAFARHVSNGTFNGPSAIERNGGTGVPLEGGSSNPELNSHIEDGHEHDGSGETVLDPGSVTGERQLPTVIDIAILDDIGYDVDFSQASQNSPG